MGDHDTTLPHRTAYRIGPSGWSYADWNGIFYPAGAPSNFDRLAYVARYFDAVEVNTSFYRPVTAKTSSSWVRRIASFERFRFTFKLHQSFTHERGDYTKRSVDRFVEGVRPVAEASRLGCLLLQFPWSFRRNRGSLDWLRRLADDFRAYPLVAEFRHDDWASASTEDDLRALGMGFCNIDQPALSRCLGPSASATGSVGYVRFHGRRMDTWFAQGIEPFRRYDYLYSSTELEAWAPRIKRVGDVCGEVYVFANNHYRGQAPANALQLRAMMEGSDVAVPSELVREYPELASIRRGRRDGFSDTLF